MTASWAALVAIDLVGRAGFLLPRLETLRGLCNYAAASLALWIVLRLVVMARPRPRVALFAALVAAPMAIQWGMFRAYGQFVEPTDLVELADSPRVALSAIATGAGTYGIGALFVGLLAMACAWLLPRDARPLRARWAVPASAALTLSFALGASYWRASPTLEHSQPAFGCTIAGVLHRATVLSRTGAHVSVPPMPSPAPRPNIVLIVGESLAASHLGLYGYARDTSPRLQALADGHELVAFRDATVMGPNTRTSVPYILTGLEGPDAGGRIFRAPTVIEYAKARGYHTAFISAQEESWGNFDVLFREGADTFRTGIEFAADVDVMRGADDLAVLESAKGVLPTLRSLPEPFFVVLHMNGSHAPYASHSPASRKIFLPEDGVNSVNAYDNTVRVTDEYVARVFEALRARDPEAWMFFTSDHGQALGEGGAFFNHGYQSNVVRDPLLLFPPRSEPFARYLSMQDAQVAACDLAPTLLHLMNAAPVAPMDCDDWMVAPPPPRVRVVSAYTPTYVDEPTLLVVLPNGQRELFDLGRGTVVRGDGAVRRSSDVALPPEVASRLAQ